MTAPMQEATADPCCSCILDIKFWHMNEHSSEVVFWTLHRLAIASISASDVSNNSLSLCTYATRICPSLQRCLFCYSYTSCVQFNGIGMSGSVIVVVFQNVMNNDLSSGAETGKTNRSHYWNTCQTAPVMNPKYLLHASVPSHL